MNEESASVFEAFNNTAATSAARPFLHIPAEASKAYAPGALDFTYGQALAEIQTLIPRYRGAGLGVGARIGLILENRPAFFLHWLALNAIGVSVVPLNGEASAEDLAYIVDDSGLQFVVTLPERVEFGQKVMAVAKHPKPVLPSDSLAGIEAFTGPANAEMPGPDSECALLYTSGSTGKPKGCMLSNHYFWMAGDWYRRLGGLCTIHDGEDRLLTPLPLVHMNALAVSTMVMILTGGCIIQLDRFHPSSFWQTVKDSGATIIHYLGVMPAILLQLAAAANDRAHKLRFGFGAGVNPKHHGPFETRFGLPLIEAWSMTEVGGAAPIIAHVEPRHIGTSCVGKPADDMEWQLVGDNGLQVAPGQPGELLVRRARPDPRDGFFSGYFGNEAETNKVWEGNWFHTGDLLREGEDGALHFVDRKKSIIRRAGENISALEVEAVLSQLPGIKAVGVTPVPDDIRGEEVFAACLLEPGLIADLETATNFFRQAAESLTYYKLPGYIAFLDALPLTPSQKLQRGEIKTLARQLLAAGDAFDLRALKKKPRP